MVLGIADDFDTSSVGQYLIALGNSVARVVSAFGLNVRMEFADKPTDIRLVENDDRIDVGQGCDNLGALFGGHQRTSLALQLPHAGIGVHAHDQPSPQRLGTMKVTHVTNVNQVKATVGQHDLLA